MTNSTTTIYSHPQGNASAGSRRYAVVSIDTQDESLSSLKDYFNAIDHVDAWFTDNNIPTIAIADHFGQHYNEDTEEWIYTVRDSVASAYLTVFNDTVIIASTGQSKVKNISRLYLDPNIDYDNNTYGFLTEKQDIYPSFFLHPLEVGNNHQSLQFPDTAAYGYAAEVDNTETRLFVPEIDLTRYPDYDYSGYWPNSSVSELLQSGWFESLSPLREISTKHHNESSREKKDIRRGKRTFSKRKANPDDIEVQYEEDQLVKRYEKFCTKARGEEFDNNIGRRGRIETDAWRYPKSPSPHAGEKILIEAKSSTSSSHVRSAVGQLLDYAFHYIHEEDESPSRLEVLLPENPDDALKKLCWALGIDIAFETSQRSGDFHRVEASDEARRKLLALLAPQSLL
ncbi:hypothetical protein [Corynebacterium nuruki]|uniref:hypothetical protein n=1 Tax=Corynebacterium nuruki TaxID=1032851 RepID=UPI002FDFA93A